jgi:hypothetical protein
VSQGFGTSPNWSKRKINEKYGGENVRDRWDWVKKLTCSR